MSAKNVVAHFRLVISVVNLTCLLYYRNATVVLNVPPNSVQNSGSSIKCCLTVYMKIVEYWYCIEQSNLIRRTKILVGYSPRIIQSNQDRFWLFVFYLITISVSLDYVFISLAWSVKVEQDVPWLRGIIKRNTSKSLM